MTDLDAFFITTRRQIADLKARLDAAPPAAAGPDDIADVRSAIARLDLSVSRIDALMPRIEEMLVDYERARLTCAELGAGVITLAEARQRLSGSVASHGISDETISDENSSVLIASDDEPKAPDDSVPVAAHDDGGKPVAPEPMPVDVPGDGDEPVAIGLEAPTSPEPAPPAAPAAAPRELDEAYVARLLAMAQGDEERAAVLIANGLELDALGEHYGLPRG